MVARPRAIGGRCGRAALSIRTNRARLPGSWEPRRSFALAESEGRSRAPATLSNAGPICAIGDYEVRFHLQLQRQGSDSLQASSDATVRSAGAMKPELFLRSRRADDRA